MSDEREWRPGYKVVCWKDGKLGSWWQKGTTSDVSVEYRVGEETRAPSRTDQMEIYTDWNSVRRRLDFLSFVDADESWGIVPVAWLEGCDGGWWPDLVPCTIEHGIPPIWMPSTAVEHANVVIPLSGPIYELPH